VARQMGIGGKKSNARRAAIGRNNINKNRSINAETM